MATRRLPTRERRPEVSLAVWHWLCDENPEMLDEDGEFSWEIMRLMVFTLELRELWQRVESDVLNYFAERYPGKMPRLWHEFHKGKPN